MFRRCVAPRALLLISLLIPLTAVGADSSLYLVTDNWPPYEFQQQDGDPVGGLSTEIIRAVLTRIQQPAPRVVLMPWARAQREALSGNADGIYSISRSDERQLYLYYPEEHLASEPGALFVQQQQADRFEISSLSDLKRFKVGVIRGYAYTPELWQALRDSGNFSALSEEEQLFKMLALGRFDVVISYKSTGLNIIRQLGLAERLVPLENVELFRHRFYLAFSKARVKESFVRQFSQALVEYKQSTAYRQLLRTYLINSDASQ